MREEKLVAYLKGAFKGRKHTIKSAELERAMEMSGTDLRKLVNKLRRKSIPICSGRDRELSAKTQAILKQSASPGIRSAEDKRQLAEAWLDLAAGFAKVTVKYEAEEWKKWQRQQQEAKQAMTM